MTLGYDIREDLALQTRLYQLCRLLMPSIISQQHWKFIRVTYSGN